MLAELDVLIFIRSNDDLERVAERVFGALQSQASRSTSDEYGVDVYQAQGLGFTASLYANSGEMQDEEFEQYGYALEITSQFWCLDLDTVELEGALSEYYARLLAFDLNLEIATAIFLEQQEEVEIFERRVFTRNTQYRSDSGPTVPKVFVVETREIEVPIGEEEWDGDEEDIDDEDDSEAEDE